MNKEKYAELVKKRSKNSRSSADYVKAFAIGGAICVIGQCFTELYKAAGLSEDFSKTLTSISLIAVGVLLTALHLYEKLAKHGGAGTLVPITGFANAMSSPAIEFKTEGFITGLAAKMFIIAGPVLVYGITAAVLYGIIYWMIGTF